MKARFYDPDVGRFLSQDTYLGEGTEAPSLHRYLYAYGNPNYYWDPDGYCSAIGGAASSASLCGQAMAYAMTGDDRHLELGLELEQQALELAPKFYGSLVGGAGIAAGVGATTAKCAGSGACRASISTLLTGFGLSDLSVEDLVPVEKMAKGAVKLLDDGVNAVKSGVAAAKKKLAGQSTVEQPLIEGNQQTSDIGNSAGAQADAELAVPTQQNLGTSVTFDGYRFYDPEYGLMSTNPANTYRFSDPSYRSTGQDGYFAGHPSTAFAEVRGKANGNLYRGQIKADNVLDLTKSDVRGSYGADLGELKKKTDTAEYDYTNEMSNRAYDDGYSGIKFPSSRTSGDNLILFDGRSDSYNMNTVFDVPVDH
ncbi:RES domain-containing protein [Marinagarivorans cellulosilyticus]|uniref:RES domain-containing protein n=1 Tax=Marinagarivorans cellulosilyticus TaxID=2721545 RepID=A0AAN1WJQ5_9GAMM|nr:RES domain-containing protein [Marinagarivorans cellulosilyticus]BCD98844.1 hypothetical protein MARGE09_P3045 [Marinagarivorans cellulosilyticus]